LRTLPVQLGDDSSLEQKCSTFADLFPIDSSHLEHPLYFGDLSTYYKLEIYEVRSNYEDIHITRLRSKERNLMDTKEDNTESKFQKLLSSLKNYEHDLIQEKAKILKEIKLLEDEVLFIANYFANAWNLPNTGDTLSFLLTSVFERKRTFDYHLQNKKRTESQEMVAVDPEASVDPIVYFNVGGEMLSILRSTILRLIPNSQLAVRVSGRWEEQKEKGDIDEEGNLIMNCHKESFKQILAALQVFNPVVKLRILVTELSRDFIEETLNYLLITPNDLVYVD
jgi:hypothetical protein